MKKEEFFDWLTGTKKQTKRTAQSRVSNVLRIDKEYNIDAEFSRDECQTLLERFEYSKAAEREGLFPEIEIVINGDYYNGVATLKSALNLYVEFLKGTGTQLRFTTEEDKKVVFRGGMTDFKNYIGPFCRNYVNLITKKERDKQGGVCQYCHQKSTLQSAHLDGRERVTIIEYLLNSYYKKGDDYFEVDLKNFEERFKEEQTPVNLHFFFLCSKCHTSYDKKKSPTTDDIKKKIAGSTKGSTK